MLLKHKMSFASIVGLCFIETAVAAIDVPMALVAQTGPGASIGKVTLTQTPKGLLLTPDLQQLPPGTHGMHVHQAPSCDNFGQDAQGHLDPAHTNQHLGPYNTHGHVGDLPILVVNEQGIATTPVLAPHLTLSEAEGHSIIIHAGGDNYADTPEKLGGGGARIACGIIPIVP